MQTNEGLIQQVMSILGAHSYALFTSEIIFFVGNGFVGFRINGNLHDRLLDITRVLEDDTKSIW